MVAAVHFFATAADEQLLLDYVLASETMRLFPWQAMNVNDPRLLGPEELPARSEEQQCYGITNPSFGAICFIVERPSKIEDGRARAYVFDRRNWDNALPSEDHGIVDWNRTAALFWDRGTVSANGDLGVSNIGSQADAMNDISADYRKWVNRVMSWVKRNSVKVAQNAQLTPEAEGVSLRVEFLNSIFALPNAMEFFRAGGSNRKWG